ncbi:hypothetical protein [Fluviispira multicolorata]|uniref:Secreted protein n=1 Tax=Fluviispira multicolorata TaxID=2654512 RepID=A0A833N5B6_9BACT|nr:hypothetical protein [Fluviispira multicolorata]KAB8033652.1 hypothetical protein GCL57_02790 [Fluviispira multicolorata]
MIREKKYAIVSLIFISFCANANVFKDDIIKNNCISDYGFIENCNFKNLYEKKLVEKNTYTLPMDFLINYSRGKCCTLKNNNMCSNPGEINLQIFTGHEYKNFEYGKNKFISSGKFLKLVDLKPWETSTTRYYQPCHLVMNKLQFDFSSNAKIYLKELISERNLAKKYINFRNNIEVIIDELNLSFAELNINNFGENLESFINSLYLISDIDIPPSDKVLLAYFINNFKSLNVSIKIDLFNNYSKKILNIIEKIKVLFDDYYKENNQIEFYKMDIEIHNIINEVKDDNNFKRDSLKEIIDMLEG